MTVQVIQNFLSLPAVIIIIAGLFTVIILRLQKTDLQGLVMAANQVSSQPFALIVLTMGFWMLVECKKWSIDTTIAGGVIGVASNMLQSQLKDAHGTAILTDPDTTSTTTVSTTSAPKPPAPEPPLVP